MDQWAFFDEFKAGTVRNVYLFYGPEAYIRKSALATLQKKLLMPGLEAMNCTFMQRQGQGRSAGKQDALRLHRARAAEHLPRL